MASLEELLAEEGFKKKGKLRAGPRVLAAPRAVSMPLYADRAQNPLSPNLDSRFRKGRTRSVVYSRQSEPMSAGDGGVIGGRPRSRLARGGGLGDNGRDEDAQDSGDVKKPEGSKGRFQAQRSNGIEEIEECRDNEMEESKGSRDRYPDKFQRKQSYKKKYWKDLDDDKKLRSGKEKRFQVRSSFNDDPRSRIHDDLKNSDAEPALDDAAIQAVVSILTGYIRRFFKDENFRASVRQGCEACLGISGDEESHHKGSGAVTNLRESIATVERVVQEVPDPIELRKACLKLSVITGLSSNDLKDGYASGIPNSHLVACAHLYLSMIYKFQKKDKVSAKHLLQVFSESPYQARTVLLPGLWDHLFLPNLSHLREWYEKEAESIPRTSSRKLLDNVYANALDMGTYQFAVYYKEWLMEDTEAPTLPSIDIPSASFMGIPREDSYSADSDGISSPHASVSSQPMVSKMLYESVFGRSKRIEEADEMKNSDEEAVEEEELEEVKLTRRRRSSRSLIQEDDDTGSYSRKPGIHEGDHGQDGDSSCSPNPDASPDDDDWTANDSFRLGIPEVKESNAECEIISSWPGINGSVHATNCVPRANGNELTLKRLALPVFQPRVADRSDDLDAASMHLQLYDLYQINRSNNTESRLKNTGMVSANSHINTFILNSSAEPIGNFEEIDQGSLFSNIPKDFVCPLTGNLFKDPVTLETGQTFERDVIKEWFDKGNRTCPITGQALECVSVPVTNFVLKHVIDGWKSEYCRNLLVFSSQRSGNMKQHHSKSKGESALFIIEKLLTGFSVEEHVENAKHLISLGGLDFLLQSLKWGNLEERARVVSLMLCCIEADGSCRSYLVMNIRWQCILELLHSEQVSARSNAVLLLIELICLNRAAAITSFVSGLQKEAIVNTMLVLLAYLESSPHEERVLVAVLLLHLNLTVDPRMHTVYREEAIDSIIMALDCCTSDKKVIPNTRRALLMLGGQFSSYGDILTETRLLKQAGFHDGSGIVSVNCEDEVDEMGLGEEEEWLKSVALALLNHEKRSFVESLSKCLGSDNPELVRACLITLAWLSHALAFVSVDEIQLSAISSLIPRLKESSDPIEHRVLASLSLHNFSKISGCRALLVQNAKEICSSLESLVEVTWTAKHLYMAILGEHTGKDGARLFE